MGANSFSLPFVLFAYISLVSLLNFPHAFTATALSGGDGGHGSTVPISNGPTVRKEDRWPLEFSEFGEVSAVKISDGENGCYHLHFITMDPNSLFVPVQLFSQMLFYVNSGSGTLNWIEEDDDKLQTIKLQRGDIYRLQPQTTFYLQNAIQPAQTNDSQKLEIYAIFSASTYQLKNGESAKAYASIQNLMLGFNDRILQSALSVTEEVLQELREGRQSLIVQGQPKTNASMWEFGTQAMIRAYLRTKNYGFEVENGKKGYNVFEADRDVENCYGWTTTVTSKQLKVLKDSDFGVVMVNLTKGAMMGPHWNPNGDEIAVVLQGQGMVTVVCPSIDDQTACESSRFRVAEGDVFVVPTYHPMAQISFNNESFVFIVFTIASKKSPPQYLAGKSSVLNNLGKDVLEKSFDVSNTTIDQIVSAQREFAIFECISCAEEEEAASRESEGRGGGGRPEEAEREGEIASREEDEMQRREREAEEAAGRGGVAEGEGVSGYGHGIE